MKIDFPENYFESRTRFREAAGLLGAEQFSYPLDTDNKADFTIDVAMIGQVGQPTIVLSSGLHGVEGHFGAAVQLAWLEAQRQVPVHGRFVLIHALNPFGYAFGRRVNEDNVDLNRNFLTTGRDSLGKNDGGMMPSDYARFDALLNPTCPPRRFDGFYLKALGYLMREGKQRLQNAIVTGQYEFKQGLFYGGETQSPTTHLIQNHMRDWIGDAEVCHIDFHTGLGGHGDCQLLVDSAPGSIECLWYEQTFGATDVVATHPVDSHAYRAQGAMGYWLTQYFDDRPYRFLTAEFGTYSALAVLGALREENQAFHFTEQGSAVRKRARHRLERCFCPPSTRWRSKVLSHGLKLIEQAACALKQ